MLNIINLELFTNSLDPHQTPLFLSIPQYEKIKSLMFASEQVIIFSAASLHTRNLHDSGLCFCGKQQTTEHLSLVSTLGRM